MHQTNSYVNVYNAFPLLKSFKFLFSCVFTLLKCNKKFFFSFENLFSASEKTQNNLIIESGNSRLPLVENVVSRIFNRSLIFLIIRARKVCLGIQSLVLYKMIGKFRNFNQHTWKIIIRKWDNNNATFVYE